jgi:hypothetical protein
MMQLRRMFIILHKGLNILPGCADTPADHQCGEGVHTCYDEMSEKRQGAGLRPDRG